MGDEAASAAPMEDPAPSAPVRPQTPVCDRKGCEKLAVSRCVECAGEDGELYFCGDACYAELHHKNARRHRAHVIAWNAEHWETQTCATHEDHVLELVCAQCLTLTCMLCHSHGDHKAHGDGTLLTQYAEDVQKKLLRMARLQDAKIKRREQRRQNLDALLNPAGDDELDELVALFTDKMAALREKRQAAVAELREAAVEDDAKLARETLSAQDFADSLRAASEDKERQRAFHRFSELCKRQAAVDVRLPTLAGCAVNLTQQPLKALKEAIANIDITVSALSACCVCDERVSKEEVAACGNCNQENMCKACRAKCVRCTLKSEISRLSPLQQERVVIPDEIAPPLVVADVYRNIIAGWPDGQLEAPRRLYPVAVAIEEKHAAEETEAMLLLADTYDSYSAMEKKAGNTKVAEDLFNKASAAREKAEAKSDDESSSSSSE
eukprot:Rhum_TRINITY_DN12262_c0_g1::Rhum_TRINITY_DN12262_c0_g1_i1::g.50469::m.50469